MFKELLIKGAEKLAKEALDPNENILKTQEHNVYSGKGEIKAEKFPEVTIDTIKEYAKNYFYGIGDIEMAEAVDSVDLKRRSKALMEAGEKCPELGRMMKEHDEKLIKEINEEIDDIMADLKTRFPEIK